MKTSLPTPSREMTAMKSFTSKKSFWSRLFNPDFRWGKRDGRIAPSACHSTLERIDGEETGHLKQTRGHVRQLIEEAKTNLSLIQNLLKNNQEQRDLLAKEGGLLAEPVALSQYSGAFRALLLGIFLMTLEFIGMTWVFKNVFGCGIVAAMALAILPCSILAIVVQQSLAGFSDKKKKIFKQILVFTGFALTIVCLVGVVQLRGELFANSLGGQFDFAQISLGNKLMMLGLTLGVPLVCGVFFEDAHEKYNVAKNSIQLYQERTRLQKAENDWTVVVRKLEEYDAQLDGVIEQSIKTRNNTYIRGFHIGGSRNAEAKPYIEALNARLANRAI